MRLGLCVSTIWSCIAIAAAAPCAAIAAAPVVLITGGESALPNAPASAEAANPRTRGMFRPPDIVQVSPAPNGTAMRAPFPFKIEFTPHHGSAVDVSTVKLTYMKIPPVDLTQRFRSYLSASGIFIPAAQLPPGVHTIRIEVADSDGYPNTALVTLKVPAN